MSDAKGKVVLSVKEQYSNHDGALRSEMTGEKSVERPLKVLIVAPSLGILGGQAVQAARLCKYLQSEPELEVSFLPINPQLPGILGKLQRVKYVRTVVTSLFYVLSLLAKVHAYDVIHIFSASYLSFVLAPTPAILVAKLYGKKTILNYRSGEAEDHLRKWRRTAIPTIKLVDRIVVCSGYLVDVFRQFNFTAHPIYNLLDTVRFYFRRRSQLRPVFLSNRNLEPLYNVACILRAFKIIQQKFPDARLTVAGDGSQRHELEDLASSLELRQVEFIGRVPPEQMPALYDAADIYLNSPNIDNMPGSIVEAFASGTLIVTTNAGGIPYIVDHLKTAMMVERDDSEAMAECAIHLLNNQTFALEMAERAHQECVKYSWNVLRQHWLNFYRETARVK